MTLDGHLAIVEAEMLLQQMARAQVRARERVRALERIEEPAIQPTVLEVCNSCGVWPMPSIAFGPDGAIRCGGCESLVGWLPPQRCDYFGHQRGCACGYSYEAALSERWFWTCIEPQAQQLLLAFGQEQAA